MTVRIACVACLEPLVSVHTPTFLNAIGLARDILLDDRAELLYFNDRASAEHTLSVAREIVQAAPDVVVGHFASACAAAAAETYRAVGIPLILPAATKTSLTEGGGVFRLCDNDADYCAWLAERLPVPVRQIETDGSAHGLSIRDKLTPLICSTWRGESTVLFSGMYHNAIDFAVRTRARTVILTDDADGPSLAQDLLSMGFQPEHKRVLVAALRPRPQGEGAARISYKLEKLSGVAPGTYFWETVASLQVATEMGGRDWTNFEVDTVLGPVRFDQRGEYRPQQFCLYDVFKGRGA
tara:strand:- start:151 stop:1038 length:888 start_codon:yes stop_codon:yes gene_type:complete